MESPSIHHASALLKAIAPAVGGFSLVRQDVGECHFRQLARVVGALTDPIPESRSKSVWYGIDLHAAHHCSQAHVREHATLEIAEDQARWARCWPGANILQQLEGRATQRDAMLTLCLHAGSRDGPDGLLDVDF